MMPNRPATADCQQYRLNPKLNPYHFLEQSPSPEFPTRSVGISPNFKHTCIEAPPETEVQESTKVGTTGSAAEVKHGREGESRAGERCVES